MSMNRKIYVGPYVKIFVSDDSDFYEATCKVLSELQGENRYIKQDFYVYGLNKSKAFGRSLSFTKYDEDFGDPINLAEVSISLEKTHIANAFKEFENLVDSFEICWGIVEGVS